MGRNQITGLLLVIIGIIVLIMVSQFSVGLSASYPGPKLFPMVAALGLVILGVCIFLQKDGGFTYQLSGRFFKRLAIVFGVTIVYIIGLKYLGYLISTPVYVYVVVTLFAISSPENRTKWWHRLIFAVIVTAFLYVFYVYIFESRLPSGKLW